MNFPLLSPLGILKLKKTIQRIVPKQIYEPYAHKSYLMFHRKLSQKKYFVAASAFGLSNRLKAVISSMRYAKEYSAKVILYWPVNDECGCRFSDLFENKLDEADCQKMNIIKKDKAYHIVQPNRLATLPKDKIPYDFGLSWHPKFPFCHIDCEYKRIPLHVRDDILPHVHTLMPRNFIISKARQFSDTFGTKTLGVSLRTWTDATKNKYGNRECLFDFDKICSIIDNLNPEKIFVTSDSEAAIIKILERYKRRVLYVPKRSFWGDRSSKEGIEDALIDQLILSKCNVLIGGYLSTYIEMAWWFGDCKAEVFIV